jgi:hypothetical protein
MVGNVERLQTSAPANIIQNGIRVNEILEEKRGALSRRNLSSRRLASQETAVFSTAISLFFSYGCTKKLICPKIPVVGSSATTTN